MNEYPKLEKGEKVRVPGVGECIVYEEYPTGVAVLTPDAKVRFIQRGWVTPTGGKIPGVHKKYDAGFKEIFLNLWYDRDPSLYDFEYDKNDGIGNKMIQGLQEDYPQLHDELYEEALEIRTRPEGGRHGEEEEDGD